MDLIWRIGILILLLAAIAWIDWRRHRSAATKWREYAFLLAAGFLGGLIGVLIDHITATISPEYFVWGKGIPTGDGFRLRVTLLGFHAGLLPGFLVGGIYLIANNPKPDRPSLPLRRLFRFGWCPILGALLMVPVASLLACLVDPMQFASEFQDVLAPPQIHRFVAVWGIHLGVYAGGILGAIWGARRTRLQVQGPMGLWRTCGRRPD